LQVSCVGGVNLDELNEKNIPHMVVTGRGNLLFGVGDGQLFMA
jgi:hypothetical protein